MATFYVWRKLCINFKIVQTRWILSRTVTETLSFSKLIWNWQQPVTLDKTIVSLDKKWHVLQAVHCTGWNNSSSLKRTSSGKDVLFQMITLQFYSALNLSSERNSALRNQLLSARFPLRETQWKIEFGGIIGHGDSYWSSYFVTPKKGFSIHAIIHDSAGPVRTHNGKRPSYWHMLERGPNECVLGHVTGLLFCLYLKLFLPSIFDSVSF